jgi:ATP-binding protein involved in chromosome partitioning
LHKDIVTLGFVKNVTIAGARVGVVIELTTPACPVKDLMREQARAALLALPGVEVADVEMTAQVRAVPRPELGRQPVEGVKNVIAVGAGKGGVGKTTVAVNLAVALAARGSRVAVLDGDMYGPNVPIMLGLRTQLETDGQKIVPAERYGIQVVSIGFLTQDDAPVIWRGPMLHGAIQQFFRDVRWNDIDYLIVDMPPGTGDIALSLSQSVPVAGAVLVTTPQSVSVADTRRAIHMYRKLNIPPIGLIENMSHFECPQCGHESDLFGRGGGEALAEELKVPFLGRVPLYAPVRRGGDSGTPIVLGEPESPAGRALIAASERVAQQVSIASFSRRAIPLTPVG